MDQPNTRVWRKRAVRPMDTEDYRHCAEWGQQLQTVPKQIKQTTHICSITYRNYSDPGVPNSAVFEHELAGSLFISAFSDTPPHENGTDGETRTNRRQQNALTPFQFPLIDGVVQG